MLEVAEFHKNSLFEPLSEEQYECQIKQNPVLINSLSSRNQRGSTVKPCRLSASHTHFYLHTDINSCRPSHFYHIDQSCQFSVVKAGPADNVQDQHQGGSQSPSPMLRLSRQHAQSMDFHWQQEGQTAKWTDFLGTIMNQNGFHAVFSPVRKLKQSTSASVYLVRRRSDGKHFAAKSFSKEGLYAELNGKECLKNEIAIMRRLSDTDQKLSKLHNVYQSPYSLYMICDWVDGKQLYEVMQQSELTHQQLRQLMKGILQGLIQIHNHGIVHRDIKPENIMLTGGDTSQPVIIDFGLAIHPDSPSLTERCGTPGYIAPEIARNKEGKRIATAASDIFSLGAVFHEILTNRGLFPGTNSQDVLAQNKRCYLNFNQEIYDKVPFEALNLLKWMLDVDPERRVSAEEALRHPYFTSVSQVEAPNSHNSLHIPLCKLSDTQSTINTPNCARVSEDIDTLSCKRPSDYQLDYLDVVRKKAKKCLKIGRADCKLSRFALYQSNNREQFTA